MSTLLHECVVLECRKIEQRQIITVNPPLLSYYCQVFCNYQVYILILFIDKAGYNCKFFDKQTADFDIRQSIFQAILEHENIEI
jgi:hypothetical protein